MLRTQLKMNRLCGYYIIHQYLALYDEYKQRPFKLDFL